MRVGDSEVVRLSICIPTFERWYFLRWTLRKLLSDFPAAELIISDNHSTDGSDACADDWTINRATMLHQSSNIGAFPNMFAALSAATGQYAVYCADDDYLLPAEVSHAIAYLDAHPEIAAYCAPCEIYDEINQRSYRNAFKVKEPRTFDASEPLELFNFLIQEHIWPEHLIYRTPLPLKARTRAYWAFADIVDILERGSIYFSDMAFYRNLVNHPVGERVQLGNVQCLTYFDEYRGGLEVLAHGLFGSQLPYAARHQIQDMISSFICTRMHTAARMYAGQGRTEEAVMLLQRISIADPRRDVVSSNATSEVKSCPNAIPVSP